MLVLSHQLYLLAWESESIFPFSFSSAPVIYQKLIPASGGLVKTNGFAFDNISEHANRDQWLTAIELLGFQVDSNTSVIILPLEKGRRVQLENKWQ